MTKVTHSQGQNSQSILVRARQKAQWMLPIATMIETDILSDFKEKPTALSAVFIGTWNRGLLEANAFRIACTRRGIKPLTVVVIEINPVVVDQSIDPAIRAQLTAGLAEIPETKALSDANVIKLADADFRMYTADTYKAVTRKNVKTPITLIKGDAADTDLADAIMSAMPKDAPTVVIGRNIDPVAFSYQGIVTTWSKQVTDRTDGRQVALLAFTATDADYADRMYADMYVGLPRKMPPRLTENVVILTPESGVLLTKPPKLTTLGGNFSDTRLHVISTRNGLVKTPRGERFPAPQHEKIMVDDKTAAARIQQWHEAGLRIVVIDAVMDIATVMHPEILRMAANLGDRLILRMDTDEYVASFKDAKGPINPWRLRATHVAHYPYVDLILPKTTEAMAWFQTTKPDVIVKSTTSYANIEQDVAVLSPYLQATGAQVIVLDESFMSVPRDQISQRARQYAKEKIHHISGSNVKAEIVRRALAARHESQ